MSWLNLSVTNEWKMQTALFNCNCYGVPKFINTVELMCRKEIHIDKMECKIDRGNTVEEEQITLVIHNMHSQACG